MNCKNCGTKLSDNAEYCTSCGRKPLDGNKFCSNCGNGLNAHQEVCLNCGTSVNSFNTRVNSAKNTANDGKVHCRNCGSSIDSKAEICVNCGSKPLNGNHYCQNCGSDTTAIQEICTSCGVKLKTSSKVYSSSSSVRNDYEDDLDDYWKAEFNKIESSNETYKGKWNWAAFLANPIWSFVKGMWKMGIIVLILSIFTYGIAYVALNIFMGLKGNYMYYKFKKEGDEFPFRSVFK